MRGFRIFHHTEKVGGTPFMVLRLLTPPKVIYEAAKKRAESYRKIAEEFPEMRQDTVELVNTALEEKLKTYVLMNYRSEVNAPWTIQALGNALSPAL